MPEYISLSFNGIPQDMFDAILDENQLEDACEHLAEYLEVYWRATHLPGTCPLNPLLEQSLMTPPPASLQVSQLNRTKEMHESTLFTVIPADKGEITVAMKVTR
ncbi:Voltage-dependent L-type calcium channel subunit beta-4 [Merluccius polli]|uniref:Voltage-dependent L-type calcium channel subunit beta-4 n=1 Tax=Merluccius polli TaxID=89951 RepID=A0AA47M4G7_MERPO|nr:Voltage-dependent L-type calcium channel subunit beta-4 [Merluccius polli]